MTAFSFQAIKHLTTGDGGALCCLDDILQRSCERRWFGINREESKPSILGERVYDIEKIGFKYHMNDLAAAIGLGNLMDFDKRLMRIREVATIYRQELSNVHGLQLLKYKHDKAPIGYLQFWLKIVWIL